MSWEGRARLQRLTGMADELLGVTRGGAAQGEPVQRELDFLMGEVHAVLALEDTATAEEFEHVVMRRSGNDLPAQVRAAELAGWLKAELAVEAAAAQRAARPAEERPQAPSRRKQTIGFKIRSPITRETAESEGGGSAAST